MKNILWNFFFLYRDESLLSNNLYRKVPSLVVISKLKNVAWSTWCSTLSSSSFGYISPKRPSDFSTIKEHQCSVNNINEALSEEMPWHFLLGEVSDGIILLKNIEKYLLIMEQDQLLLGCQLIVSLSHFQH